MRYDGKRWGDDIEGLSARASAKVLSDALVRYAMLNMILLPIAGNGRNFYWKSCRMIRRKYGIFKR